MAFITRKPKETRIPSEFENLATPTDVTTFAQNNGVSTSPLDVSALTKLLGITMHLEPMDGEESGSLVKDKKTGKWVMKVNSLHHFNRQRFTIAHEIGHYIKHSMQSEHFQDKTFFRNGETNRMEMEANQFAAELLMPAQDYHLFVETSSAKVEDIAEHFQVSSMAVRIRAKQLGYQGHNV
ncbi:ImmA/IrrE family metallo-endopeptidase [Shewanella sp. M16]|uniref:ImmA/IrrE family metallo-endopeptidase n=1 Tax=Shewanella sp. M16 TaxID=2830837 RepID=UPI001BAEBD75|nr:ImmA/IrrE family metallo-endopeptidase [Shewanella sp. M16]MBS0044416.1 ImmA/IrrE family metallo-endopeptidase [Shewanella sp. M16]